MDFLLDFTIQERVETLLQKLDLPHIKAESLTCMKSEGSKSNAIARIWGLSRNWQMALGVGPHYIIEVISRRFDKLSEEEKDKVLIHELLHIPKTFSGALVPHRCFGKERVGEKEVERLYNRVK